MSRLDSPSLARLEVMGVDVWTLRQPGAASTAHAGHSEQPDQQFDQGLRVRLASGDGAWLLVQRQPWRGDHDKLLADITATIGVDQIRYGQWASGSASGERLDELAARGIRHVVSFGPPPIKEAGDWIEAAGLDMLARDARARRQLWQALAPRLVS